MCFVNTQRKGERENYILYFLRMILSFFKRCRIFSITLVDSAKHSLQKSINLLISENRWFRRYFYLNWSNLMYVTFVKLKLKYLQKPTDFWYK